MDTTTLIGVIGATLILIGFVMNQSGKWTTESFMYDIINLLGGAILVYYAWLLASWPFLVLNVVWTLVSLRDVLRR